MLAMSRAVNGLARTPQLLLVDGNNAKGFDIPARAVVGGDGICPSIAAASVLAKVARDRYCEKLDADYPEYGFLRHKGYGTKEHIANIKAHGITPAHRRLFVRKYI